MNEWTLDPGVGPLFHYPGDGQLSRCLSLVPDPSIEVQRDPCHALFRVPCLLSRHAVKEDRSHHWTTRTDDSRGVALVLGRWVFVGRNVELGSTREGRGSRTVSIQGCQKCYWNPCPPYQDFYLIARCFLSSTCHPGPSKTCSWNVRLSGNGKARPRSRSRNSPSSSYLPRRRRHHLSLYPSRKNLWGLPPNKIRANKSTPK